MLQVSQLWFKFSQNCFKFSQTCFKFSQLLASFKVFSGVLNGGQRSALKWTRVSADIGNQHLCCMEWWGRSEVQQIICSSSWSLTILFSNMLLTSKNIWTNFIATISRQKLMFIIRFQNAQKYKNKWSSTTKLWMVWLHTWHALRYST